MLPQYFKFHVMNNLGVDMDLSTNSANEIFTLYYKPWKFGSTGLLEYGSEVSLTYSAGDVADGESFELTAVNNSSNLWLGAHGYAVFETDDGTADGTVDLYIEHSTDGGTTFPSDATNFDIDADLDPIGAITIGGAHKRATNFELE